MPYSGTQLIQFYTRVNRGQAPDAATQNSLSSIAVQNSNAVISDTNALLAATRTAQSLATTDVALVSYQFFTGLTPTSAGIDYLVNTPGSGFNTSAYNGVGVGANGQAASATNIGPGGFNLENRYFNEAVALAGSASTGANFRQQFGSLTLTQTVQAAYEAIVSSNYVGTTAANAAIAAISNSIPYFTQVAQERAGGVDVGGAPGQQIAVKAIIVGYILEEALKANVGGYAIAVNNFNNATALGTVTFNSSLSVSYGPGSAGDIYANNIIYYGPVPISVISPDASYRSTNGPDVLSLANTNISGVTIDLGNGDNVVIASLSGISAATNTFTALTTGTGNDTVGSAASPLPLKGGQSAGNVFIDAGQGTDTGYFLLASNIDGTVSIKNIERLYFQQTSGSFFTVDASSIAGATTLGHSGTGGSQGGITFNNIAGGQALVQDSTGKSVFNFKAGAGATNPVVTLTSAGGAFEIHNASLTLTIPHAVGATANIVSSTQNLTDPSTTPITLSLSFTNDTASEDHVVDLSKPSQSVLSYITSAGGIFESDKITLGSGADTLNLSFGALAYSNITLGAGADTVFVGLSYQEGAGGVGTTSSSSALFVTGNYSAALGLMSYAIISDFTKGADHLNLELGTGVFIATAGNAQYASASSLTAAVSVAASLAGANNATTFEYGGNSYVYQNNSTASAGAGDVLIQLAGVSGLSVNATAGATSSGDVHFG